MHHAERQNGKILNELWRNCGDSNQVEGQNDWLIPVQGHFQSIATNKKHGSANRRVSQQSMLMPNSCNAPSGRASPIMMFGVDDGTEKSTKFLRLNIGGSTFLLLVDSVLRADQSGLLAKFIQLSHADRVKVADGYLDNDEAYYFQRSPEAFEPIYQVNKMVLGHIPSTKQYSSIMRLAQSTTPTSNAVSV